MKLKYVLIAIIGFSLTACLEVEDKSGNRVAAALEQQNQILQQQDQTAQEKSTITLNALVTNLATESNVTNATATLNIGGTVFATTDINDGQLKVEGVPPSSNYELVIHSKTDAFMDRAFYGISRLNLSSGAVFEYLGTFTVAPGVMRSFAVFDIDSGLPISTLKCSSSSNVYLSGNYSPPSSSLRINSGQTPLNKQSSASPAPTPCLRQVER